MMRVGASGADAVLDGAGPAAAFPGLVRALPPEVEKSSILIVDDRADKLLVYQSMLESLDQNLVAVQSGEAALKAVLRTDFAVILLDVNMPGMDGFETARLIRGRRGSAHVPIIFLTAYSDDVRSAQGYAYGAVDYISTPVVPEILRAKVRVFVDLFQMRQQVARQAGEQARREAAEEAARWAEFLADASRTLASSLDPQATLRNLARLAVPMLGDASFASLVDGKAAVLSCEWAWLDDAGATISFATSGFGSSHAELDRVVGRVLGTGRAQPFDFGSLVGGVRALVAGLEAGGAVPPVSPRTPLVPARAGGLVFPLSARGRVLGVFGLVLTEAAERLGRGDLAAAVDLAGRAGVALDNALLVRDVQDRDRRKSEFLSMLAHELRNPLAPIRNAVEIIKRRVPEPSDLAFVRGVIDRQVSQLTRLVDDLLDVSRITSGKIRLEREPIEIGTVVARAVETSRPLIEQHRHVLSLNVPDGTVTVIGDATRLAQVLANLLNNAAKYTPDGGRIDLDVETTEGEVVIEVRDTGAGIPPDMLDTVFDLFTQVDRSLDRSQGGLGIGLTLVKSLVELHHGSVHARSEGPGRGSVFEIRLPRCRDVAGDDHRAPLDGSGSPLASASRILVVDDNVDAAQSLAMVLAVAGHEVRQVHDGEHALAAVESFRPEVVLLDIGLPGLDGYEVARRLRASPRNRALLLVAVSGYGQDRDRHRSALAGFDHHLTKPVDFELLERVLATRAAPSPGARAPHP